MAAVQFGLSEVHYATFTYDEATKEYTYGTPKKIMCAVSLAVTAVGDVQNFYCDNKIGFVSISNQGYEGTITGATLSTDFRKDVLGEVLDTNGLKVEYSNIQPKEFALLYQVEGDPENSRFVFWKCKASRPSATHNSSTESITVDTQELSITMLPREDSAVKGYADVTATIYANWFTTVVQPDVTI